MLRPHKQVRTGIVILALALLLVSSLTTISAVATRPNEEPTPEPEFEVFVPIIAKQIPPTPTPTPTPVNVSGDYDTAGSNMVTDCPGGVALPEPAVVTVVHNDTQLTMAFPSGLSEGTINPITGEFQIAQIFPPSEELRYGGSRSTIGIFRLTQNPLVFNAITSFVINSQTGIYCTFSFNHDGTRK